MRTVPVWSEGVAPRGRTRCSATTGAPCCGWPTSGRSSSTCRSSASGDRRSPPALVLDLDPPEGSDFARRGGGGAAGPRGAGRRRAGRRGEDQRGQGRCTSSCRCRDAAVEDVAAATRALAARTERWTRTIATTAYLKEERGGKVFVDSTRAGPGHGRRRLQPAGPARAAGVGAGGLGRAGRRPPGRRHRDGRRGSGSGTATRGRPRCRSRRSCPRTWSPRGTPSRSPGSWRCTRAGGGRRPSGTPPTELTALSGPAHDEHRRPPGGQAVAACTECRATFFVAPRAPAHDRSAANDGRPQMPPVRIQVRRVVLKLERPASTWPSNLACKSMVKKTTILSVRVRRRTGMPYQVLGDSSGAVTVTATCRRQLGELHDPLGRHGRDPVPSDRLDGRIWPTVRRALLSPCRTRIGGAFLPPARSSAT